MKKKFLFTLLTLVLALSCAFGMAACGSSDPITYELSEDGNYYTVTKIELKESGDVEIPSEYKGKPVKRIKYSASIGGCYSSSTQTSKILNLVIPGSVNYIGSTAFPGVQSVTFKDYDSVELTTHDDKIQPYSLYIGKEAFEHYHGSSVTLPANVYLEEKAFQDSDDLTGVKFEGNIAVDADGNYELRAFDGTLNLASLELPEATVGYKANLYNLTMHDAKKIQGGVTSSYSLPLQYVVIPQCIKLSTDSWCGYFSSSMIVYPPKLYFKVDADTPANILSTGINLDLRVRQTGREEKKLSEFVYYYSEEQPATTGAREWHYVNGVPTEW